MVMKNENARNPATDNVGTMVERDNQGQAIWVLPGTVNEQGVRRTIRPGNSKPKLFVVAASSHATPKEYEKVHGSPPPNATALRDYAQKIHDLWNKQNSSISYGPQDSLKKETFNQLKSVILEIPSIDIHSKSYYKSEYGVEGPTEMITMAFVKEIDLPANVPANNPFKIVVDAHADGSTQLKETEYDIGLEYTIRS